MKRILFGGGLVVISLFCFTSSLFAADGFAEGVTGGAGGPTVTVDSNVALFKSYSVGGTVSIRSNKTIRGINANSTIIGNLYPGKKCNFNPLNKEDKS
jgi:hypothetical protein